MKTPLFDEWRTRAARALAARGRKAELARHLEARYGRTVPSWQVDITRYLSGEQMPGAEPLLAIDQWLTSQSLNKNAPKVGKRRPKSESNKNDG